MMRTMSRLFSVLALSCVASACGQAASPTGPAANPFSESTLRRIVSDVGGGNSEVCIPCRTIQGVLTLDSSLGTLSTVYPGTSGLESSQKLGVPTEFHMHNGLFGPPSMTATGRVAEYELRRFSLSVTSAKASLSMVMNSPPPDFAFLVEGSAEPTFAIVSDASCASGQRLETKAVFNLQHLGRTELRDVHCIPT